MNFLILLITSLILTACERKTSYEPIIISKDVCHYCKMVITDKRFGAEFVTEKGKTFKFDAIECFGHYFEDNISTKGTAYIVDSFETGKMLEFKKAYYYNDPSVRSPMGRGLFSGESKNLFLEKIKNSSGSKEVLTWQEVLKLIGRSDFIPVL